MLIGPDRECPHTFVDCWSCRHLAQLDLQQFALAVLKGRICWSRRYAERIWGEFFILARRNLGKSPANFSANFDGEFR